MYTMDQLALPLTNQPPLLQYIMLKNFDNVRGILENDATSASLLDSDKKTPLHAAAFAGTKEIAESLIMTGGYHLVNSKDNAWITPLHMACKRNNYEVAYILLQYGADVSARTKNWQTPAHVAAANGSVECMKYLVCPPERSPEYELNNGIPVKPVIKADINIGDRTGRTCLHLASYFGFEKMCKILIESGANLTQGDKRDRRPLHWAVSRRNQDVINLLTEKLSRDEINLKDKDGNTPLHAAASVLDTVQLADYWGVDEWFKSSDMIEKLTEAGADLSATNNSGNTVLHTACFNGNSEALPTLLSLAAEFNLQCNANCNEITSLLVHKTNHCNQTPLHFASFIHDRDKTLELAAEKNCLDILLEKWKSLVEYKSENQMTALHVAARCGSLKRVKSLLDAGAQVNAVDSFGRTPLHIAAIGGHYLTFDSLLKSSADFKLKDGRGRTPLHLCAQAGSLISCQTIIVWLSSLGKGIDHSYVNAKENEGMTCLHFCAFEGSADTLRFLIASGADVTVSDNYGRTPLHYASANSHIHCALLLVEANCDVNSRDKAGCTALHAAAGNDVDGSCVEYLLSHKAEAWMSDIQGYTPLHYAAANGNVSATMILIQLEEVENCDRTSTDRIPQSYALYLATYGKHEDALIVLLSRFSDTINHPPEITVFSKLGCGRNGRRTFNSNEVKQINDKAPFFVGLSLLHVACKIGHAGIVQQLLDNGADVFMKDFTGNMRTALHYAVCNGHDECVKILLNNTSDLHRLVNMKTTVKYSTDKQPNTWMSSKTALMEAAINGHYKIVRLLCKHGAGINTKDKFGRTALYMASANGKEECVETLIEMNADIKMVDKFGKSPLHVAALKGHVGILGQLIDRYKEVYEKDNVESHSWDDLEDRDGVTPLQWAAYTGQDACVEILTLKENPEELVSYFSNKHKNKCLLKYGAFSPVHCAVLKNQTESLRILLENLGPKAVNIVDRNKRTPLHLAIMSKSLECITLLLDYGAKTNCRDDNMRTPLMLAAKNENLKCVELLLSKNCDTDSVDAHGNMALHYGCQGNGNCANAILKVTQDLDPNISHQNCQGQTPLHISASRHLVDTCELLLIKGATVSVADNRGLTPALAVAPSDDAVTCLTMILEALKMEIQTGSYSKSEAIKAARRSISSIGSFRLSDSSFSSRLSDTSTIGTSETTFSLQHSADRLLDSSSVNVKKRSLPTLIEDVQQSVKIKTEVQFK